MVTLTDIERESYKDSPVHRLDPRVKMLFVLSVILYTVSLPRIHEENITRLLRSRSIFSYLYLLPDWI